ncbi:beta-propeller fold lactonase family protein [Larkinella bovis]|uniref:Beta-propeller fold lactonase family protein n=1 Tax=Larkinella bovis TaxID=683041 RepID=A0ABW0I472_9BACT
MFTFVNICLLIHGTGITNVAQAQFLYVVNVAPNVSVVDVATNQIVATLPVGITPLDVAISPDGKKIYVGNLRPNVISVINAQTNQIEALLPTYESPRKVLVNPNGKYLYTVNALSNNVLVFNTATNLPVATITIGENARSLSSAHDGSYIYIGVGEGSPRVHIINTINNTIETTIPMGGKISDLVLSPDGRSLYVTHDDSRFTNVSVINLATNKPEKIIPINDLSTSATPSLDGSRLYLLMSNSKQVGIMNTNTFQIEKTIPVGNDPVAISLTSDGSRLYVANKLSDNISVINTLTEAVETTITTGRPVAMDLLKGSSPSQPSYEGFLDKVECGSIRGWVWDKKRPNTPLTVEFTADGKVIGTALANIYRQDIKEAGKGNGEHVYNFTTPDVIKDGKPHSISARVQGTNYTLKWTPKPLTCPAPNRLATYNSPSSAAWSAVLLGNPVETGVVEVEVKGAQGQPITLSLVDSKGQILKQVQVKITDRVERHHLSIGSKASDLLLLQVSSPTYSRTLKVVSEN